MINGSDEGRLMETLRVAITGFATTVSLTDAKKVVIIDEADYMKADTVQPALRSMIEEFSKNCRFIFTCNYKNRLIEPLHSRCTVIEFKIDSFDKQTIAAQFFKRATQILKAEEIEFDPKVVAELITKHFPDYRRILNELQRYSVSGAIDKGILSNVSDVNISNLIKSLREKDFGSSRKWVASNLDNDAVSIIRKIYDSLYEFLTPESIPPAVLILSKYQYQSAFVADHEINLLAAMTEIMCECEFK